LIHSKLPTLSNHRQWQIVKSVRIFFEVGVGLAAAEPSQPGPFLCGLLLVALHSRIPAFLPVRVEKSAAPRDARGFSLLRPTPVRKFSAQLKLMLSSRFRRRLFGKIGLAISAVARERSV
jgi:hypothetical protein